MADIDAELLALAGDASSDEEDTSMNMSRESSSAIPSRESHAEAVDSSKVAKKYVRKARRNDSEEEGEASSRHVSPESAQSEPMDESDSEAEGRASGIDEPQDLFPLEGLFKDVADKSDIMALPEIKREEILAERAHQAEREKQNRALKALLSKRDAGNKRKVDVAKLDETDRKTQRQRRKVGGGLVGEASSGIDNLKKARAEKTNRQRQRQEDKEKHGPGRNYGDKDVSDAEANGESEVEWDDKKSRARQSHSPVQRDAPAADLRDIERVRTGRTQFALVCFYPGFHEAINGCFVRISVGPSPENGENIYRMAVIKGFTEGKPYAMETANGKHFVTNQYIRAAHGKLEKEWPFISCSNSHFTEGEFNRFKQTCLVEGVSLPSKAKLVAKIHDINALVNRSWTEEELQEKLNRSGALKNKYIPIERNKLTNDLKAARVAGNEKLVAKLQLELETLNGPKLAFGTTMQSNVKKTGPKELTQQERLAALNKENRRKNAEEVRNAQIRERRAFMANEAAIARGETVVEDHSRRVKTRAKFKHDVADAGKKTDGGSGTSTPGAHTPTMHANIVDNLMPHLALLQQQAPGDKKSLPTVRRPICDDDIIGAIDLGIEIEL